MTPTERHWDHICLTILTKETGAQAAVFLITNLIPNRRRAGN